MGYATITETANGKAMAKVFDTNGGFVDAEIADTVREAELFVRLNYANVKVEIAA